MTTATEPAITRELIHDRWRMATTETVLDNRSPSIPSDGVSKPMRRLMTSLELLAGALIEDGINHDEEAGWDRLQYDLLTAIEERSTAFALEIETARAARRERVA